MQTIPRFAQIYNGKLYDFPFMLEKNTLSVGAPQYLLTYPWTTVLISAEHVYSYPGHQGQLFKLTPVDLDLLPQLFQRPDVDFFGAKKGMKLEWNRWVFMCQSSSKTTCQVSRLHSLQQKEKNMENGA